MCPASQEPADKTSQRDRWRFVFCLSFFVLHSAQALGRAAESGPYVVPEVFEEVIVSATRIPTDINQLPFAAGLVSLDEIQTARQQLGLDEALATIPGLFFQNRYNFAQDLRIAIRGFGAQANFGIRGIRIFADDIPLTLPDGQTSVDAIDLGSAEQIEVIRGPFSAVFGAASGGVINIRTEEGPSPPFLSGRVNLGSYGYRQFQAKTGGDKGHWNWLANVSSTRLDGYRDHSEYHSDLLNSKFRYEFNDGSRLTLLFNAVDSPEAQDPGGLNSLEVAEDRRQAAPRNLLFNAGESLDQQTMGLAWRKDVNQNQALMLRAYYVLRDFNNRLPFDVNSNGQGGSVDLDRKVGGLGGHYRWTFEPGGDSDERENQLVLGFDLDAQRDHRKRFANNQGTLGELTTNQDEDVSTAAIFVEDAWDITLKLALTLGARYDEVDYKVTDHTGSGGSGRAEFSQFSPIAGLLWSLGPGTNLYGNVSRSFDPPTTTELANPEGSTGFNQDLDSQTATNYELGVKGLLRGKARYELALVHIDVKDAIVPFELGGSGQSFFENAGRSTRRGAEAALSVELLPGLTGTATYTWSDFTFDEFRGVDGEVFDGNRVPGIPEQLFNVELDWSHSSGLFAAWNLLYAGSFFADNANEVETDDYLVSNLRAGYRWAGEHWEISPFVGVNNMFDEKYMSNVRLNASFGRYWEPAPKRNVYGGVLIRYDF
jgi:iron complex outermembrane receptor protein